MSFTYKRNNIEVQVLALVNTTFDQCSNRVPIIIEYIFQATFSSNFSDKFIIIIVSTQIDNSPVVNSTSL